MASHKRRERDIMKLLVSDYDVLRSEEDPCSFQVKFHGPTDSPYEGGLWTVGVSLPDQYPFKSPSIGFNNRIYHPNVDESSGSVCLDVINQTWSPMYELINVFDVFLPQLLLYPNPTDPLNIDAASMLLKDPERYKKKVRDYVEKYASPATSEGTTEDADDDLDDDEDELSEPSDIEMD